ncbi:hypothetical protein [Mesorhizobium argentiipisi]|uniref:Secreted protein n=1 Tax=Mesorhizobium argentiipisi TaxID=3015175 RepID=A0ABU8KEV0_9HYPH
MDWLTSTGDLLKIVVGAGLGSAFVQASTAYLTERWTRKTKADFLALRIAVMLETFTDQCAQLVYDNEYAEEFPDEPLPNWSITLPTFEPWPDDIDGWRSLDQNLVGRCLNFRSERDRQQRVLRDAIEYVEDDAEKHVAIVAADIGLAAWGLAEALRTEHGLLASQPNPDAAERLERRAKWAQDQFAEDRARQEKLLG